MYNEYKKKITAFYERHKRMPSYTEIMELVGYRSKNAVYKLVEKLVDEGVVEKDSSGRLVPTSLFGEVPMLGLVEAGIPSLADADMLDSISIDNYLVENKERTFVLEVKGDSMIDAHIAEGDFVIAERTEAAKPGDIVIAEVDHEWTMKYYRTEGGMAWLEPANPNYDPIYPAESLRIAAVVKGVIRKY